MTLIHPREHCREPWLLFFSLSVMSDSATPWTRASQAPLSMGLPRQEYGNILHECLYWAITGNGKI